MSSLPNHITPSVCGLAAGALVYSIQPRGLFDAYDIFCRAMLVGAISGCVTVFGHFLSRRWNVKP